MHDSNADLLKRVCGSDRVAPRSTPSEPGIESMLSTMRSSSATSAISNAARIAMDGFPRLPPRPVVLFATACAGSWESPLSPFLSI